MSVREMIQDMINELTDALGDAEKHDSGNNAAGTRIRKVMQSCKGLAQDARVNEFRRYAQTFQQAWRPSFASSLARVTFDCMR